MKILKTPWEPFGSYLLNSKANLAQFEWKWAGLAAPKSHTQFFSNFQDIYFFNYFIKNPQTTIALTFLTHIISAIGGVDRQQCRREGLYSF